MAFIQKYGKLSQIHLSYSFLSQKLGSSLRAGTSMDIMNHEFKQKFHVVKQYFTNLLIHTR